MSFKVKVKDDGEFVFHQPVYVSELSKELSEGAVAALFNSQLIDLRSKICEDGEIEFIKIDHELAPQVYRHTLSHIMAQAVMKIYGEDNVRLGIGISKALLHPTDPLGKAYRRAMTNLVAAYLGLNIINKILSGHFMFENDPGHTFELEAGYTKDGQKRYLR
ncbi:MAG: hypothetical protein ACK40Q_06075, partial [Pseudothermotoga sp.]